jgi:UDP-N-acetylmuramoyl-tripeptide--D-alanyl-D-alanine ligase
LEITGETQIAIIEMGANHQSEIEQLCLIAEPSHGLITNIGKAHLGGFGGFEGVIKAKNELYAWLRTTGGHVFVNADNPLLMELTSTMKRTLYGMQQGIYTQGKALENPDKLVLDWNSGSEKITISTNLAGNYNFENAMAAICVGTFFNVPVSGIKLALSTYFPSNSRSQAMKTARNSIILDAYNANPSSMKAAIENFSHIQAQPKMLILGDMLELGDESPAEHQFIVNFIRGSGFDKVIFVGPDFTKAAASVFPCFSDSGEAREWLLKQEITGFTILVKGSRGIKMEKVLDAL